MHMAKNLSLIILAFAAGLAGAWTYQQMFPSMPLPSTQQEFFYDSSPSHYARTANEAHVVDAPLSFIEASERSTPSVVFIKNFSGTDQRRYSMFDYFFGTGNTPRVSTGSGVIISGDGYIITNNHVIDKAETIEVVHKKRTYPARLIGTDANTDIAVLKIDVEGLPAITRGSSRDLRIGEWVIAVGNPFNLTSTVTAGIVSAKERQINILGGEFPLESFIQTDAPINPGNSGGALVNIKGELVGINTAILSRTGSYTGYGFAVPVDIAMKIANDLIRFGEVQKAIPGLDVLEITPEMASEMKLASLDGVVVNHVIRTGAAEKAGLQKNDIIVRIEGFEIFGKGAFEEVLSYYYPGDKIKIQYKRNNELRNTTLTLQNLEGGTGVIKTEYYASNLLGARLEAVNSIERDRLGINFGIKISNINRGYLRELGLNNGFVLTHINGEPAKNPEKVGEFLEKFSGRLQLEGVTPNGRTFQQTYNVR
jgi:serine protease Do